MSENRIRDQKPDLVSILPHSFDEMKTAAQASYSEGKINDRDMKTLEHILEDFERNKLPDDERNIHDLIKYTVRSEDTHDELLLEQLIYRIYDLGIPSMWGPVIE